MASAAAEASGGAGGPPIIHRVIPHGVKAEPFRNVDFIMDKDTNKFRYFICCIHGELPRNSEAPVKRLPSNTIFIQPGFGDDCGKVMYVHTFDYFKDALFQTVASRSGMFAYLLGHFGLDEDRSINRVLSSFVYNTPGDTYVDKLISLSEADTQHFWGVHEVQFNPRTKKYIGLVPDDVITNRVRKIRGAGVSITRNSELINAINAKYPCTAETEKIGNIIITISCSVAQVAAPARNTRGCSGAYCEATYNDYTNAVREFGSYKKDGSATKNYSLPSQAPQHPSGVPYVAKLPGYLNPENLNEAGMKSVNEYIGHVSQPHSMLPAPLPRTGLYSRLPAPMPRTGLYSRLPAPMPRMESASGLYSRLPAPMPRMASGLDRCVDPPREPGFCEWLSGLVTGSSTAITRSKKNDRKRKNRTLRRRRT